MDTLLLAQTVLTACLAGWMITGALDNWLHPRLNRDVVGQVTRMELMERDHAEHHAGVAHRRLENPRVIDALFWTMVAWETLSAILLSVGTVMLTAALLGLVAAETARPVAILGALAFTVNWAGFLIGGNYFAYWYSHFPAQVTHFALALWGTLVVLVLNLPG